MKLRDIALCLSGGWLVYVAMAACSFGGASHGGTTARSGAGGAESSGGSAVSPGPGLTDPVPTVAAEPAAGSRLKPKYRLGADGAKEFLTGIWFDSQRNEDCSFAVAGDGVQRCLPQGKEFGYFSDASCRTPIAAVESDCTAPVYGIKAAPATCGTSGGTQIFALTPTAAPSMIYALSGTTCYNVGQTPTGFNYFAVGNEVQPASFVSATTKHD